MDNMTCLTCGMYQGVEAPVHTTHAGWVQTGGFAGPSMRCECCGGLGWHDPHDGVPKCHTYTVMEGKRRWLRQHPDPKWPDTRRQRAHFAAIARWDAEAEPRTLALFTSLYGPEKAAELMAMEPPL